MVSGEPAVYEHDLGNGMALTAYAVDPALDEGALEALVKSKDGSSWIDLDEQAKKTVFIERLNSLDELEIEVADKEYSVPEQLQDYRDAIGARNDAKGWYNGPVAIVDGAVQNPLKVFPGGFYDFVATKLDAVPSELLPDKYPEGTTIEELFKQWGVDNNARGKYFGIAYLLASSGREELSLVQRAKGMAIAADCISSPGSTPNPPFGEEGFDIKKYLKRHVAKEMKEEYKLGSREFAIGGVYLFDDKTEVPFMAVEIVTPFSTRNLAQRIYGDEGAIKEHPALFAFSPNAINTINNRFEVFPPIAYVMDVYSKNR